MFGWWLGQGLICFFIFAMSSSENHSTIQWLFSKVSNNLGIHNINPGKLACQFSNCNCEESLFQVFGAANNSVFNLKNPDTNIRSIDSSTPLFDISNTDLYKKNLIVWNLNTVDKLILGDNTNCVNNLLNNSVLNSFGSKFDYNNYTERLLEEENFGHTIHPLQKFEASLSILESARDRMVTSPLSSNNVPCNAYPIIDKKKVQTATEGSSGTCNNKGFSGNKSKNKENYLKQKDSSPDIKKDYTNRKKSEKNFGECKENSKQYRKSEKLTRAEKDVDNKVKNNKHEKGSDLDKVGKLLQEVLRKTPGQNQENSEYQPVAEASSGGSDTGYSSRCSTPPASNVAVDANLDEDKFDVKRHSLKSHNFSMQNEEVSEGHRMYRSESPSAFSDTSSAGSSNSYQERNHYQGHQRFHFYPPQHSQKPFQRQQFYFMPGVNKVHDDEYQRRPNNTGFNGRMRGHANGGMHYHQNYRYNNNNNNNNNNSHNRKVDKVDLHQSQTTHHNNSHNSSHLHQEVDTYTKPVVQNGRHYQNNQQQKGDGKGRHWGFNQRYHNGKIRQFNNMNGNVTHLPANGFHNNNNSNNNANNNNNNSNIYYQIDSQFDLREEVWGHRRLLNDRAGSFRASSGDHGKWKKDHRVEVTCIPPELLKNSEWDGLSHQVWSMFNKHQQLDCTFRAKMELRQRISHVIWNVLPMCRLFVVGSSLSGFGANSSDVDMCLMVTPRDLDQRNEAQAVLRLLQRELNNCGFVEKMELITAKVPILKFRDLRTKIDVDLNCNNSVGIRNTHLLNAYSQLDWRVRPLVLVVKLWAQHHHINNAKDMTISSYSLVLMVIHYLQYGLEVPLLPCLHKAFPDKFSPSNHVFRMPVTERMPLFVSNNKQTLGELFLGFLEYYAHKFMFIENSISIRTGGILPTDECRYVRTRKNDSRMWKYLCIEEPFDLTNTARSVYDELVFEKVRNVFKDSCKLLKESKNLEVLFSKS
ncbi:UNVERIFIED_CONTAM: hypothetical protein RMT77_010560 [Armadillidium vulgare]